MFILGLVLIGIKSLQLTFYILRNKLYIFELTYRKIKRKSRIIIFISTIFDSNITNLAFCCGIQLLIQGNNNFI